MNQAARLKLIREKTGISQAKFAKSIDTYQEKIADIEIDKQKIPIKLAEKIRDIYGVNFEWLLAGKGEIYVKNQVAQSLQDIKQKYNLNGEELEFITDFLVNPQKREAVLKIFAEIKKYSNNLK